MQDILPGIVQIIVFLILGYVVKRKNILSDHEISTVKKLIMQFSMPALLFISFSRIEFSLSLVPVTLSIIVLCIGLAAIGRFVGSFLGEEYKLMPVFNTTINFGFVGIILYEAVFGIEKLEHFSVFGIGHDLFIWFLFYPLIGIFFQGEKTSLKEVLSTLIRTPIMWGLIGGCIVGITGVYPLFQDNAITHSLFYSLERLSSITAPLILLFIGYSVEFIPRHLRSSLVYIGVRLVSFFFFGYMLKLLIIDRFIADSLYYEAAYFLLMLLPPVYIMPLLLEDYLEQDELIKLNNAIVMHSLITIIGFVIYSLYIVG